MVNIVGQGLNTPVIFSVVRVNLLVLFFPHVFLECVSVFELLLAIETQQASVRKRLNIHQCQ